MFHPHLRTQVLTACSHAEDRNLQDYLNPQLFKEDTSCVDLTQLVRTGRGRGSTADGHLPTLTTNTGKLYSKEGSHGVETVLSHVYFAGRMFTSCVLKGSFVLGPQALPDSGGTNEFPWTPYFFGASPRFRKPKA